MWSETQQIAAICKAAQARARSEDHNVIVEYHPDSNEYLVVNDENDNSVADDGETVTTHPVRAGLMLAWTTFTNNQLVFDSRGRATSTRRSPGWSGASRTTTRRAGAGRP